ncbi:carbohydrate binding domain-containing protein [Curtobacterium sp. ZW137]|uniref:carbohydrate binding domain-containing protein n=1 Tax=Curtobacterium sp. ZW137 TaxID=2485104 RepID=UPI000FB8E93C|nr:carbohydrate binding domain-containing protein [Curtobacterium sp. ZW137]ROP64690.1 carbohydrate binding protein [Curtobacterium sp. ZW137]
MSSSFTSSEAISSITHAWAGAANASASIEYTDGVETRRNQILNPGFEANLTYWSTSAGYGTTTRDTTVLHSGTASAKFVAPVGTQALGLSYSGTMPPVTPGQAYTLSYWAMVPADLTATYTTVVSYYDANTTYVSSQFAPTQLTTATDWTRVSVALVVPANAVKISFALLNSQSTKATVAEVIYVDDVIFQAGDTALDYFDGSTPTTYVYPQVTPRLVTQWNASATTRHIVHEVLGNPWPDVTVQPAGPRSGTMAAIFESEDDAVALYTMLTGTTVVLFSDDSTSFPTMRFLANGQITIQQDAPARTVWAVTFSYMEVQ